jgi:hypothetical protein
VELHCLYQDQMMMMMMMMMWKSNRDSSSGLRDENGTTHVLCPGMHWQSWGCS